MSELQGWDLDDGGGNSKIDYTKFPEGLTVIRLIDAKPNMRWQHWYQPDRKGINCPGKGCPICDIRREQKANKETVTHTMSKRFSLQIFNKNTGKVEIMEQGITFFEDLKIVLQMAVEKNISILDVDLSVRRKGMEKDNTTYRIDLGEESELTKEQLAIIEKSKIDINKFHTPHTPEQILKLLNGEKWEDVMGYIKDEKEEAVEETEEEFELE